MNEFASGLNRNAAFIVRNISATRRTIKIFNHKIPWNQERNLIAIPGISAADVEASLIKGDIRQKLELNIIEVVQSNLPLTQFNQSDISFLQSKNIPFTSATTVHALGNVSGNVTIDLTLGCVFTATLVGNTTFAVTNGWAQNSILIDLTMGGAGNYTLAFNGAGGLTVVDPSGVLAQVFSTTTAGARSVGLWFPSPTALYALGYNAS